ncbi:hypothetical protein ILYODFUR_038185 [Ilyodon furcidens]|uniref:Uncharacterized protein n=1 Tax=Ilyodon furcidens TaxID=33524 RepID=A0ABV0ST05_9TELE
MNFDIEVDVASLWGVSSNSLTSWIGDRQILTSHVAGRHPYHFWCFALFYGLWFISNKVCTHSYLKGE